MSTVFHHEHESAAPCAVPDAGGMRFGIVVSEWNRCVTEALLVGAVETLLRHGASRDNIIVRYVPGSFELTYGAACFVNQGGVDAVIALGSVVRGDTPHFDYVCQGATQGIAQLNALGKAPVIFGVLTTDNMDQALERAGGKLGNKGSECAETAIKMARFACGLREK